MEEAFLGLPLFVNGTSFSPCDFILAKSLYSVVTPVIILLTLCCNVIYVVAINYTADDRSASTLQQTGIAISNTLLGLLQLPVLIYFFNGSHDESVSIHWCYLYRIIGYVLPNMFHTASVWQVVLYGIQRFMSYRWPFNALAWYKIDRFLKYTIIIYIFAIVIHISRLFDFTYSSVSGLQYRPGIHVETYIYVYQWLCTISIHAIPCIVLTLCVFLLVYAIRLSYLRRKRVFVNSQTAVPRNRKFTMQESQSLAILLLVLSVEWPMTIIVLQQTTNRNASSDCTHTSAIIAHFALLVSFPLYFPICLILNYELRNTLVQVYSDLMTFFRR